MTTKTQPSNVLGAAVRAFQEGDAAKAAALMAPDIAWHSPGRRQPAAGDHLGVEQVMSAFGAIASQPGELELLIIDVLGGSEREAVIYTHRRTRDDARLDAKICLVGRVDDGRLIEVWEHIYDLHEFDEFYGAA